MRTTAFLLAFLLAAAPAAADPVQNRPTAPDDSVRTAPPLPDESSLSAWEIDVKGATSTSLTSPYGESVGLSVGASLPTPEKWSVRVSLGSTLTATGRETDVSASLGVSVSRSIWTSK